MADEQTSPSQLPARRSGGSMGARAQLEVLAGPEKGQTFRVAPGVTLIGRDPSCDVQLSETAISRQHCRIDHAGEEWILRNLSSNGTRIKRKEVEEHVLSDGDEIRIGAKTRMQFILEEVARPTAGRPQFRPRMAGGEPDQPEAEAEPAQEPEEERAPSLFQRRKGLFIGLAVYLGLIIIAGIALMVYKSGGGVTARNGGILRLTLEAQIIPPGESTPLRVEDSTPTGFICVDPSGRRVTVPRTALQAGEARWVPGIREAIEVEYLTPEEFRRKREQGKVPANYPYVLDRPRSRYMAKQCKDKALQAYMESELPGNEGKLLTAVRLFQQALAHYGMRFLPDHAEEKVRQKATKRLIETVASLYKDANNLEKAGNYTQARANYETIHDYIHESHNLIHRNVSQRLRALREKIKEERR